MSGDELRVLAQEQAALRRVATLVARGTPPEEVFAAVTEEAGRLLSVEYGARRGGRGGGGAWGIHVVASQGYGCKRCARTCVSAGCAPMSPPFASWMVVAVALIVAETLVVYLLRRVGAGDIRGCGLPGGLECVGAGCGGRGAERRRYWFLYVPASVGSVVSDPQGAAAPTIVIAVAVVICSVAAPARSRSICEGRASTVER